MGNLTEHFSRYEFACKDGCGGDSIDVETLVVVEDVRTFFDSPVTINSAFRCVRHNKSVGGASNSQHLYGRATDIRVLGRTPAQVADYLEAKYPRQYGIGRYNTFTHIDTRSGPAVRWRG